MSKIVTLNDLGYVNRGRSKHRPRNAPELYGGPYPFVQTADIKHADLYLTKYGRTYSELGLAQSRLWPAGTLCITIAATIADTAILGCEACFPDSVIGFIPDDDKCDVRYVKYLFDTQLQTAFKQLSQGVAQDNLSKDKLLSIKFSLPDLPVQRRIADVLSAYDDLIENNRRRIAILEETARLTYRKWFNENSSLIASVRIGEFIELQNGFAFKSNTFVEAGQYKIITIKNVKDVIVDSGNVAFVNRIPERMPIHCRIHPRDILLSLTGNVGRVSIAIDYDGLLNQRVAKVKSDFPWCSLLFLTSNESFSLMNNLAVGAAQQNLSPIKLCDEFVEMPIRVKMAQIEKLVAPLFDQIVLLAQQNTTLAAARDMLLPRLMNGQPLITGENHARP